MIDSFNEKIPMNRKMICYISHTAEWGENLNLENTIVLLE